MLSPSPIVCRVVALTLILATAACNQSVPRPPPPADATMASQADAYPPDAAPPAAEAPPPETSSLEKVGE